MKKYNYKKCQSLFGYSANVHIRCKGICQLCECGGEPLDFDLWRQMTVEHLIGKSQNGYLKQIKELVEQHFESLGSEEQDQLSKEIDSINTVTACQFCNSATSRDKNDISMVKLFTDNSGNKDLLISEVRRTCDTILIKKRKSVQWKLESVKEAFEENVLSKL